MNRWNGKRGFSPFLDFESAYYLIITIFLKRTLANDVLTIKKQCVLLKI